MVVVARRYKNGLSFSYGELTANHNQLSDVIAQKQLGLNVLALIRIYVSLQWYFKYECLGFNDMRLALVCCSGSLGMYISRSLQP